MSAALRAVSLTQSPLDWVYPWPTLYQYQHSVLWVVDQDGHRLFLPQVVIIAPASVCESSVHVQLVEPNFKAPIQIEDGFEFYRYLAHDGIGKRLFDGENARLLGWNVVSKTLFFQGAWYFDYLKTNLALDLRTLTMGSLREHLAQGGTIEDLSDSKLANPTGINGLIFSNDGHMIFQARLENVLVRPGELCSGFSGTVDKTDIIWAVNDGGSLDKLDAPRELVEELGINRRDILSRRFLGLTRELVRGGQPELFYSVDVALASDAILARLPQHCEGSVKKTFFGTFATSTPRELARARLPECFWSLVRQIQIDGNGPISVPLLTNLVLWYQLACPTRSGNQAIR
jgi:hypothetical protein